MSTPSPMYLAIKPSDPPTISATVRWYAAMISRRSSGSSCAESAVEPTRSQNITVNCRRAAAISMTSWHSGPGSGRPSVRKAAIAASNFRRCPTRLTPISLRSSAVSSGSTAASISLSRKAFSYCCNPRSWSHAAISTLASLTRSSPRSGTLAHTGAMRECLARPVAAEGDAVHDAALALVVVDRVMLGAAIVPERDRADLPAEAAGEFRTLVVREQILQQRCALLFGHVLEAHRMAAVDIKRPAAGLRVGSDHGMLGHVFALGVGSGGIADAVLAGLHNVGLGRGIGRDEAIEQPLHPWRQGLVGEIHVRKQGVAAIGRQFARDQHCAHRRPFEVSRVTVPEPAEIDPFVLEFDDRGDLRETVEPFEKRVFDDLAKAPRESQETLWRLLLAAKENHQMVEPGAPDRRDRMIIEVVGKVDAADFRAQRAADRADIEQAPGQRRPFQCDLRVVSQFD